MRRQYDGHSDADGYIRKNCVGRRVGFIPVYNPLRDVWRRREILAVYGIQWVFLVGIYCRTMS